VAAPSKDFDAGEHQKPVINRAYFSVGWRAWLEGAYGTNQAPLRQSYFFVITDNAIDIKRASDTPLALIPELNPD
jgi:hypothetical protein